MQLLDDVILPVLVVRIEPLVELFAVAKDFGQEKVQQGPKFMQTGGEEWRSINDASGFLEIILHELTCSGEAFR